MYFKSFHILKYKYHIFDMYIIHFVLIVLNNNYIATGIVIRLNKAYTIT